MEEGLGQGTRGMIMLAVLVKVDPTIIVSAQAL